MLLSAIEKDGSTMLELYYAVNGFTALSGSDVYLRDKADKVAKLAQSMLRKDDNLWKYDVFS